VAPRSAARSAGETGVSGGAAAVSRAEGARRVLSVLQAFSPGQHTRTARDLAEATSIPLPSMYRYIALLRDMGLLIGDDRGAYHLSPRLISLARAAEAAESLIEFADPVMRDLVRECGETTIFVRLIARVPVCVHRVEAERPLRAAFEPGQSLPLFRGATGRVLLAGLPEQTRCEYLEPLRQADPEEAARVVQAVAAVVARGWATSEEEIERGVWAASAPVTDGRLTVGALTVPSLLVRAPSELQQLLLSQVRAAAARLSQRVADAQRS
jgi:DNA-binding IclR family transcriptional regulator